MHMIESSIEDISTKHLVHGLKEKGYNVSGIANLLEISPAAVSQHLKAPPKKPYTCHIINSIMKTYESKKYGEWQSF
jgi:predicted transcriptional regulator